MPVISYEEAAGIAEQPKRKTVSYEEAVGGMSMGEDVLRSGATGVQQGLVGMVGLPGDVRSLAVKGIESATGLELPNMPSWMPATIGGIPTGAKTSEQLQTGLQNAGMPVHEPQTTAGEYAQTIGQFAPAAVGGAGGLVRRGVQALVPAVASESAGQVARRVAPEYEDAARVAGGIAGIVPATKAGASKIPKWATPDTAEIKDAAQRAYGLAEQSGLKVKGTAFLNLVGGLIGKMKKEGLDPTLHPRATAAMRRLDQVAREFRPKAPGAMSAVTGVVPRQSARGVSLDEIDTLRQVARQAAQSIDPNERRLGTIIIDRIDDLLDNLPGKVQAGNWQLASQAIKEARSLWHRMRKSEQIDNILEVAKDDAGQYSVSGHENAIRKGFRQLSKKITKDKREAARWTPEELKLIRQLAGRMTGVNFLRTLGKLAPRGVFTIGGGILAASQDPISTGAVMGGSTLAHLAALGLTKGKTRQLQSRVRSGGQNMIPGAPASPGAAAIAGQASTIPLRDQLLD